MAGIGTKGNGLLTENETMTAAEFEKFIYRSIVMQEVKFPSASCLLIMVWWSVFCSV